MAACGGVTTDNRRREGNAEGGSGGTAAGSSDDYDGGVITSPPRSSAGGVPGRSEFGAGGAGNSRPTDNPLPPIGGATQGPIGDGGSRPIGDGGAPPSWGGGGAGGAIATGGAISVDAGNSCRNVFEPMNWEARCAPLKECLDLDPASWSPAPPDIHGGTDAAAPEGTTVAEMRFCSAPANRRYLFAFEESGAWYDDFNIVTGDEACVGRNLAFMGIGGVGDAPLARVRTHCFSVDGALLGSRIAVVAMDRDAVISNLRAVTTCPCPYPIPYNVNSCPGVQGSAGHPNCG